MLHHRDLSVFFPCVSVEEIFFLLFTFLLSTDEKKEMYLNIIQQQAERKRASDGEEEWKISN